MAQIHNTIILLEHDQDDRDLFSDAYSELGIANDLKIFREAGELKDFLESSLDVPFFILCDYNLPQQTGFELWNEIRANDEWKYKSIPFLLWSTTASEKQLKIAYDNLIQGFFVKPADFNELKSTLTAIITYWSTSRHPKKLA